MTIGYCLVKSLSCPTFELGELSSSVSGAMKREQGLQTLDVHL